MLAIVLAYSSARGVRTPVVAHAVAASSSVNCGATVLTVHPGLHPALANFPFSAPANAPRSRHTVALPEYPGATPLQTFVASPFPEVVSDQYLQTASAVYTSTSSVHTVQVWLGTALIGCGWKRNGSWSGNAEPFTQGLSFVSRHNPNLGLELSFGFTSSGGAYIAYGVEEVVLPKRPSKSYLHGPFTQLHISLRQTTLGAAQPTSRVVTFSVSSQPVIRRLVATINAIRGYRTVLPVCYGGGPGGPSPAWLSFVKPNGTVIHAYEIGPGACGGLAVNHVRWMTDGGAVWKQIQALAKGQT
jgi:hypothetical protein